MIPSLLNVHTADLLDKSRGINDRLLLSSILLFDVLLAFLVAYHNIIPFFDQKRKQNHFSGKPPKTKFKKKVILFIYHIAWLKQND